MSNSNTVSFLHSYNLGDLISVLPGIRHFSESNNKKAVIYQRIGLPAFYYAGNKHSTTKDGEGVSMNERLFYMLKPLLEEQEYIQSFEIWEGQDADFNFDITRTNRNVPVPYGDIHYWPFLVYPELAPFIIEDGWIRVRVEEEVSDRYSDKIIINRTERYNNPYMSYHFLKEHQDKIIFTGTEEEHSIFNKQFGLKLPYLQVDNFLDLAKAISACKFFMGNQSFCWHLANAMGVPKLLEFCTSFPNTYPTSGGWIFTEKEAAEYYFNILNR